MILYIQKKKGKRFIVYDQYSSLVYKLKCFLRGVIHGYILMQAYLYRIA